LGFTLLNLQSFFGLFVLIGICWALSENRKRFPWKLVLGAVAVQAFLVLVLFAVPGAQVVLKGLSDGVDGLTHATQQGTAFVFGYMAGDGQPQPYQVTNPGSMFVFAFQVLPVILVVSALSAVLWHWGVLKVIVRGFGFIFAKTMGLKGATSFAVALNIFLGTVETPMMVKGYLNRLTRSELFLMMTVGLATVAGSTMTAYALMLKPVLANAAGHVFAASVISAPAGVAFARIMVPEKDLPDETDADFMKSEERNDSELKYDGTLDAIVKGVADGLTVVLNISAVLIVFVALVALGNQILKPIGHLFGYQFSIDAILGVAFTPLAWLMGVPTPDLHEAGRLLGVKLTQTEFAAFLQLGAIPEGGMAERTRMLLTYALCGFANFGSVGITVFGLTVLAPERRQEVMDLIWKALVGGFLATLMSAAIVGCIPGFLLQSH
jgi:CNT family concentrative nucleoside transporter